MPGGAIGCEDGGFAGVEAVKSAAGGMGGLTLPQSGGNASAAGRTDGPSGTRFTQFPDRFSITAHGGAARVDPVRVLRDLVPPARQVARMAS